MYHNGSGWYQSKTCRSSEPSKKLSQEFETVIKHDGVIEWSNSEISQVAACKINLISVLQPLLLLNTLHRPCAQSLLNTSGLWARICAEVTNKRENRIYHTRISGYNSHTPTNQKVCTSSHHTFITNQSPVWSGMSEQVFAAKRW